jgi:hypothetical protein
MWDLIVSAECHGINPQQNLTRMVAKIVTLTVELEQFRPEVRKANASIC